MVHFSRLKVTITIVVFLVSIVIVALSNFSTNKIVPGIKLGLDLQGGSYLFLQPDLEVLRNDYVKKVLEDTNHVLSHQHIAYNNLTVVKNGVSLVLGKTEDFTLLRDHLLNVHNDLKISLTNNKVLINISEKDFSLRTRDILNQSIEIIRRRIDEFGTNEPLIKIMGNGIVVELPGIDNPQQIKSLIGRTARISFHYVDNDSTFKQSPIPLGYRYVYGDNNKMRYAISLEDILTGEHLTKARLSFNQNNQPVVSFVFDNYGAKKFAQVTSDNVGKILAIVLDNKVISAPVINTPILGGSGIIEGKFTLNEAQDLALLLQAGSLPVPLNIVEENTVGPTLGADSIKAGLYSSILGLALVFLYMVIFYRKLGVVANLSLVSNVLLTLATLSLFGVTLTLPGIAGIILGMGMAVDSNILVYERFNFESKYARAAIAMSNSFSRVYQTLIDSNFTTLFAAVFLFYFGSGPIRGFAVTLIIAIVTSMFSIFFTTRFLVNWLYLRKT